VLTDRKELRENERKWFGKNSSYLIENLDGSSCGKLRRARSSRIGHFVEVQFLSKPSQESQKILPGITT
jgi:hypothetical protein